MVKKLFLFLFAAICLILFFLTIQQLRESHYKKKIIEAINHKANGKYRFSGNKTGFSSEGDSSNLPEETSGTYKFVYEMNFDCSRCYIDLKEIYDFYIELNKIRKVEFLLITPKKSLGYIDFQINQSLKNYNLKVIQQEFRKDGTKLCLVDASNNIVFAGDITRYSFLKNEYIKHLNK